MGIAAVGPGGKTRLARQAGGAVYRFVVVMCAQRQWQPRRAAECGVEDLRPGSSAVRRVPGTAGDCRLRRTVEVVWLPTWAGPDVAAACAVECRRSVSKSISQTSPPAGSDGATGTTTSRLSAKRAVWLPAALAAIVFTFIVTAQLLVPRSFYTGTNNAGASGDVLPVRTGQSLCVRGLRVPAGTGRVEVRGVPVSPSTQLHGTLRLAGGAGSSAIMRTMPVGGVTAADLVIAKRPSSRPAATGILCMTPSVGGIRVLGRPGTQPGQVPPTLNGAPVPARVAVWFRPPYGERASLASQLGAILDRAALFRPGVVGPWFYVVLLFVVLPASWLFGVWLLARGQQRRLPGMAGLAIALIAFVVSVSWALVEPAFNAPDETDHFAYVQTLAERGRAPSTGDSPRSIYSTDELAAVDGAQLAGDYAQRDGRPPWLSADERQWAQLRRQLGARTDGGGGHSTVAPYSPLYYAAVAPAYLAASDSSIWSQLTALRVTSAVLGGLTALFIFLLVLELLPAYPAAAVAAGLLVAYQPMVSFMFGVVNNDAGVSCLAALTLWLLIRALRRGLTTRLAIALGAALVLLPFAKGSGFFLYPAAAVALGAIAWRAARAKRLRELVRPFATLACSLVLVGVGTGTFAGAVGHEVLPTHSGSFAAAPAAGADQFPPRPGPAGNSPTRALSHLGTYLSYTWQLFFPRLPGMVDLKPAGQSIPAFQIYVERSWASFGLVTVQFARWVYLVILAVLSVAAILAILTWRRFPAAVATRKIELLVLAMAAIVVLLGVEAVYFRTSGGGNSASEQGRYLFPALATFAVAGVGASFAFGRRTAPLLLTAAVVAMMGLQYAAMLLALGAFYT